MPGDWLWSGSMSRLSTFQYSLCLVTLPTVGQAWFSAHIFGKQLYYCPHFTAGGGWGQRLSLLTQYKGVLSQASHPADLLHPLLLCLGQVQYTA